METSGALPRVKWTTIGRDHTVSNTSGVNPVIDRIREHCNSNTATIRHILGIIPTANEHRYRPRQVSTNNETHYRAGWPPEKLAVLLALLLSLLLPLLPLLLLL
jgi:hypothetical protein